MDAIVRSWSSSGASTLLPGAALSQLWTAEATLGRSFPLEFMELYLQCNGGTILDGKIGLYP